MEWEKILTSNIAYGIMLFTVVGVFWRYLTAAQDKANKELEEVRKQQADEQRQSKEEFVKREERYIVIIENLEKQQTAQITLLAETQKEVIEVARKSLSMTEEVRTRLTDLEKRIELTQREQMQELKEVWKEIK